MKLEKASCVSDGGAFHVDIGKIMCMGTFYVSLFSMGQWIAFS